MGYLCAQPLHPFAILHFTFSMLYSVPDLEVIEFPGRWSGVQVNLLDEPRHPIVDGLHHLVHLLIRPFQHQLDPAIWKISHIAADVVLDGDVLDGVTEPNPLNAAAEVALPAMSRAGVGMIRIHELGHRSLRLLPSQAYLKRDARCYHALRNPPR